MTAHSTGTGHIPDVRAVSWACTCGAAEVIAYSTTVRPPIAMRLAAERARNHRKRAALTEDLET